MYGIALEGGGAKGSYQVGAWKAIVELGLEIGGVAGTSIGAINGALILQESLDEAIELWSTTAHDQLFDMDHGLVDRLQKMDKLPGPMAHFIQYFQAAIQDRGLDTAPLKEMLNKHINEEKIRKSKKDFGIVTISLSDRTPVEIFLEEIPQGELVDYILASASLPIFQSHFVDGKRYLDGGFYNNLPINMLLRRGHKNIIAIMIGGLGIHRRLGETDANIIVIEPKENLGAVLDINPARAKVNINLGYYDTLRVFNGYRGRRYYLKDVPDEGYFAALFMRLPMDRMSEILQKLKLADEDMYLRSMFEKMIPAIAKTLKLDKQGNYSDIVIALLERAALRQNIERFKVYSFPEFLDILDPHIQSGPPARSKLVRIIKKSDLLPGTLREEVFNTLTTLLIHIIRKGSDPK